MKYIRMGRNLNLHTVNLYELVSILDVLFINEVIRVAGVHYDDNPVLNPFLTDREHYFIELFFIRPLFRFIADESSDTLNRFQFCRLITGRSLDASEHDTAISHFIDYIRLGSLEILSCSVQLYLLHHFGNDRHTSGNHRVAGVENLMHYLFGFRHFKGQTFNEGGSIEGFTGSTPTGDKDNEFLIIGVQRVVYRLGFYHFSLSLIQESILIPWFMSVGMSASSSCLRSTFLQSSS